MTRISLVPCLQLYPVLARSLFELTVHRAKYQWYTILAVQCIKRDQNLLLLCTGKAGGDKAGCSIPSSPIHRPLPAPTCTIAYLHISKEGQAVQFWLKLTVVLLPTIWSAGPNSLPCIYHLSISINSKAGTPKHISRTLTLMTQRCQPE